MRKDFSDSWKSSTQPRKQRKYAYNLPLHKRGSLMSVHLSADLRKKYEKRSIRVRKGDKVKVIAGQHKGKTGKVEKVTVADCKVMITGINVVKKDGTKSGYSFHPSNLMIEELDLSDKKRFGKSETSKKEVKKVPKKETPKTEAPKKETKPQEKKESEGKK